jgi:hypothetical protein
MVGRPVAEPMRIFYGGSVKPENAQALLSQPEIDRARVGGASLDSHSLNAIVKAGETTRSSRKLLVLQHLPDKLQLFLERRRWLR